MYTVAIHIYHETTVPKRGCRPHGPKGRHSGESALKAESMISPKCNCMLCTAFRTQKKRTKHSGT